MSTPQYRLRNRLESECRWEAFKEARESIRGVLVENGVPDKVVWKVASLAFPPLDGSPHEISVDGYLVRIAQAIGVIPNEVPSDGPLKAAPIPDKNTLDLLDDDAPDEPDEDFAISGEAWSEAKPAPALPVPVVPAPVRPAVPDPVKQAASENIRKLHSTATKTRDERDAAFADLFSRVDRKKRCKPYDMVQWVFEHAGISPSSLDPEDIPSAGALRYLQLVQESNVAYAEFMKTLYSKTIPDKRQLDYEAKQREDGTAQLKLLDQFDEEFAALQMSRTAGAA